MKKIFALIALFISHTALADFNTALDAYSAENFESAYQQFRTMAENG